MDYSQIIIKVSPWFLNHGLKIIIVIVIALFARRFSGLLIEKLIRKMVISDRFSSKEAEKKREDTLIRIFSVSTTALIWVLALLMILQELGVAIGPLLAAAGIAGLAFGGQYLIRDLISGLFVIMENQYRIDDVVCFGDTCGLVEDISLRMTTLKDLENDIFSSLQKEKPRYSQIGFARSNDIKYPSFPFISIGHGNHYFDESLLDKQMTLGELFDREIEIKTNKLQEAQVELQKIEKEA